MSRGTTVLVTGAVLVAVAGGAAFFVLRTPGDAQEAPPPVATGTAEVTRGDLTEQVRATGTLGFSAARKVSAGTGGVLTWLPSTGKLIRRDGRLYEIDGLPVRLMYGRKPMYRPLKSGMKGEDVRQLETNLKALGYDLTVDEEYTWATARAVRAWQESHDLPETGETGPGQIAFAPGTLRVQDPASGTGERVAPGAPLLTTSGADRVVRFDLEVRQAATLATGDKVAVELPDATTAKGKIEAVGRTAKVDDQGSDKTPKVEVTVAFDRPGRVKGVDQAPVTVLIKGDTRRDVLSVPVTALLALQEGGYGVRSGGRDVRVELGLFAGGRVEVSGAGLRQGMKVEVPAT